MSLDIKSVLLLDGIDSVCAEKLRAAGLHVEEKSKRTEKEFMEETKHYDCIVVRSATKVTKGALSHQASRLKLVGRAGTGTDNIDLDAATSNSVVVMNTPGGNTLSAAEHTCALICSLARFLPQACTSLKAGAWDRKKFMGTELYGKTLAIIGLGRIGREVASRMQAFGMKVVGYDPMVSSAEAAACNIDLMKLDDVWPVADYISVHTPLLPHTRNLVGPKVLAMCKKGVKIVNAARGGIIDEEALLHALNEGVCGGAGLDVYATEPPTDLALCQHPKVICTPHLGASTIEAQIRVAEEMADQIIAASKGGRLTGLVNAQAMASGPESLPWLHLVHAMGQISAAVLETFSSPDRDNGITCKINLTGEGMSASIKSLGTALMAGIINHVTNGKANLINTPALAAQLGVVLQACGINPTAALPSSVPSGVRQCLSVEVDHPGKGKIKLISSVVADVPILYQLNNYQWPRGAPIHDGMMLLKCTSGNKLPPALFNPLPSYLTASVGGDGNSQYVCCTHRNGYAPNISEKDCEHVLSVKLGL